MQRGQVLIISLIFMVVIMVLAVGLLGFVFQNVAATRNALAKEQALQVADAGIDKAIFKLNQTAGAYMGETDAVLGTGVFDVAVSVITSNRREITSSGYVPDKSNPRAKKTVKVEVIISNTSVSFNYGVQVGLGGLIMDNNSQINGNVYSNSAIDGAPGAIVTGDAFAAESGGHIFEPIQINGHAHAHTIDNQVIVGGNAYGQAMNNITVNGSVFTNSISNCTVAGSAFYTTISSCTVSGTLNPGYPGEPDPPNMPLPITDQQINDWKNAAESGGTIVGDFLVPINSSDSLGPKKITGNLIVDQNATLTLTGTIWVEGNITSYNNSTIRLDPAYGDGSETLVSDGLIDIVNNTLFQRAGPNSYIVMLTTAAGSSVFKVANNSDSLVAYANNGEIEVLNNAILREVTGYKLRLRNNAIITYESGLANLNFTGGPGASWNLVRGTWREIR